MGKVGQAVLAFRVEQQGSKDVSLQHGPEDGQQLGRRASH